MRTGYKVVLVLATVVFLVGAAFCLAEKKKTGGKAARMKLTEEKIDRLMEWLADDNPQQAEELQQLREKNPQEFKAEVGRIWQRQFGPKSRKPERGVWPRRRGREAGPTGMPGRMGPGHGREAGPTGMPGRMGPGPGRGREGFRGRFEGKGHAELFEWLKENYPEEAEELETLREKNPELLVKRLRAIHHKYRRIREEENPKLAEVLKEDLELKKQRGKLLKKVKAATNKKENEELTGQLEEIVSRRFDLIIKRKQLRYEQLRNQLEKLKKRVKKSEEGVAKLKDGKNKEVKVRLKELLEETEGISWD